RARIRDSTVNTILSFTVPFLASVPAELVDSSGLVAAVVAGLVTGFRAPRLLPPRHRLSDAQNWASVELVLEGLVFLLMGLELATILSEVHHEHTGIPTAIAVAAAALAVTLLVRAAYVTPLLWALHRRARRGRAAQPRLTEAHQQLEAGEFPARLRRGGPRDREPTGRELQRVATRFRRVLADIDYLISQPLGVREGAIVVWAGMRGAVTVAAAQTLPADTPHRALLVFIAFAVATLSLLVQGGTVGSLVARLYPVRPATPEPDTDRQHILELLHNTAEHTTADGLSDKEHRIAVLTAQRNALLDARDDGRYDAEALTGALRNLDAAQIALELRGGPTG
ncbi:MAG: sodium:proton antiporter, partial [Nocardia sp.]|nr:sodium:proton antiporter [Nocardia sp.]